MNEKGEIFKVEGYYINKHGHVKGNLVFSKQYLKFEPIHCPENEPVSNQNIILSRLCSDVIDLKVVLKLNIKYIELFAG